MTPSAIAEVLVRRETSPQVTSPARALFHRRVLPLDADPHAPKRSSRKHSWRAIASRAAPKPWICWLRCLFM